VYVVDPRERRVIDLNRLTNPVRGVMPAPNFLWGEESGDDDHSKNGLP